MEHLKTVLDVLKEMGYNVPSWKSPDIPDGFPLDLLVSANSRAGKISHHEKLSDNTLVSNDIKRVELVYDIPKPLVQEEEEW